MADTRDISEHGLECISKATQQEKPGYKNRYMLRTSARYSGLSERLLVTTMDVGDTATAIPTTPLSNRNHAEIHNTDLSETLYVSDSNLITADNVVGTTSGKEIPPRSFFNVDIQPEIQLYAIAPTGKTIRIKITEVA